jgi:hypothetical protein
VIGFRGDAFGWLCSNRIAEHAVAYFGAGHQFMTIARRGSRAAATQAFSSTTMSMPNIHARGA